MLVLAQAAPDRGSAGADESAAILGCNTSRQRLVESAGLVHADCHLNTVVNIELGQDV